MTDSNPKLELDNQAEAAAELITALQGVVIEGAEKTRDHTNYVTLRNFSTECTINAEWAVNWGAQKVITKDSVGNEYIQATLNVTVSYQNHGSNDLELVTNRIKFILACCEAANQLKAAYQDKKVYQVWNTIEEKEEKAREKNNQVVTDFILVHGKGMRVGTNRSLCDGDFSDKLVPGSYEIPSGSFGVTKKYSVTVSDSKVVNVTRTE